MSETETDDLQRFVYFVGSISDGLFHETMHIVKPTLQDTGALFERLRDGDLKEKVIHAWGLVLDDDVFDEFMAELEPARIVDDLYRVEIAGTPGILIDRAIQFLNGTFTPGEDGALAFLRDAMMGVRPPLKMAEMGIAYYLRVYRNAALPMLTESKDDLVATARP